MTLKPPDQRLGRITFPPALPALPSPPGFPAKPPSFEPRVRPDIILITLLDDLNVTLLKSQAIAVRMESFLKAIEEKMLMVPKGVVETFDNITVTANEQVFDTVAQVEQLWFSATVYNEGPDSIQVRASDGDPSERAWVRNQRKARYITLAVGESVDMDFSSPKLRYIYYKLASGSSTATLKIVGEW